MPKKEIITVDKLLDEASELLQKSDSIFEIEIKGEKTTIKITKEKENKDETI